MAKHQRDAGASEDAQDGAVGTGSRTRRQRLRAAWMYFVEEMTQQEIADRLGIGRVTVVRLLADARERNEVRFHVEGELPECVGLERQLEARFGLDEAIVVPLSHAEADAAEPISAATGRYISQIVRPGMQIGLGWGRTLHGSLRYIQEIPAPDLNVVSLLGGITKVKRFNPSEFAWRFSRLFQAQCFLLTAPAIVDSPATRRTLIDKCGLSEVFERARALDAALFSVGELDAQGTAYRNQFVAEEIRLAMIAKGAVGEVIFHFFDAHGRLIQDPIQECVMAVPVDTLRAIPQRILASGGLSKAVAILGALRLLSPTVLVIDEFAAARVLKLAAAERAPVEEQVDA